VHLEIEDLNRQQDEPNDEKNKAQDVVDPVLGLDPGELFGDLDPA
jgi:hypothetical protein